MLTKIKAQAKKLNDDLHALSLACRRKDVPLLAKILISAAVVYALSPIDLIPDFIPILGMLDDLLIIPALLFLAIKLIPTHILNECRQQAQELQASKKTKKWYYALPIVGIWLLIAAAILKAVFF